MKSYRAIRHDVVRQKQANNEDAVHHPNEKKMQIARFLKDKQNLSIIEFFAGQGNLTKIYERYGTVTACDKKLGTGDSFLLFHKFIAEKKTYDVIDLDPYGFPNRFFPDIFLLMDEGFMFITCPKPYVNILNGITRTHLQAYYGQENPPLERILEKIQQYGLCHWRVCEVLDVQEFGKMWRIALKVIKVKATEHCNVNNRYVPSKNQTGVMDFV